MPRKFETHPAFLGLSARIRHIFYDENIDDVDDILKWSKAEWLRVPNFGKVCLKELEHRLFIAGKSLRNYRPVEPKVHPDLVSIISGVIWRHFMDRDNIVDAGVDDAEATLLATKILTAQKASLTRNIKRVMLEHAAMQDSP